MSGSKRRSKVSGKPTVAPVAEQASAVLDLDVPLGMLQKGRRAHVAASRVEHHLLHALNALSEAAHESRDDKYIDGARIVHAVAQAILAPSPPLAQLKDLSLKAARLLEDLDPEEVLPSSVHELAAAKIEFLRAVDGILDRHRRSFPKRAKDGRLNWDHLTKVAASPDCDAGPALKEDARHAAFSIVLGLFFDQRLLLLHPAAAHGSELQRQASRVARVLIELVNNERATPLQVARATLFVLGKKPAELKNFFSPEIVEAADAPVS